MESVFDWIIVRMDPSPLSIIGFVCSVVEKLEIGEPVRRIPAKNVMEMVCGIYYGGSPDNARPCKP